MRLKPVAIILIAIMVLGGALRLWNLGAAELTFDEGLYAFRSVGYLDYLESAAQPTPIQHFDKTLAPFWTRLSFHDHPPLFFLIQYIFFSMFGDSLLVARLPSALTGIASLLVVFLITKELFQKYTTRILNIPISEWAALSAALLLSVNFAHILMSRLSMMEAVLFLF